jgi:hypothetical protein
MMVMIVMKSSTLQNNKTKFKNEKERKGKAWLQNNCDGNKLAMSLELETKA